MSDNPAVVPVSSIRTNVNPIPLNHVMVSGRIALKPRRYKTKEGAMYSHIVKLPAPDSFSSPQTIEINAIRQLGEKGEDIIQLCVIGGYGRSYDLTDKSTGEVTNVSTADIRLYAKE